MTATLWVTSMDPEIIQISTPQFIMSFLISIFYEEIFQDLLVLLFVCLTYLAAINIEAITKDVSIRSFQRRNVSPYWLRQWKKNYFAVHEYVKEINRFFGPTLILIFCKISVYTIVACYKFVAAVFRNKSENPSLYIVKTITDNLLAAGFIVATQRMEEKVILVKYFIRVLFPSII